MPDGPEAFSIRVMSSIHAIPAAAWDACAGSDNPFVQHAYLAALEDSGSAAGKTGWLPQHLAVFDPEGTVLGCMPCYLKSHSYGEYVFDWGWADAYLRAGARYYPKLQAAVPFTPVPGPRLLVRPDADADVARVLAAAALERARQLETSSVHVTFARDEECRALERFGFLRRCGVQYHWTNRGYGHFDDFLGTLQSRKRKQIRKERASLATHGVRIRTLTGAGIEPHHWDTFYDFYLNTVERKWAHAYLNRAFFSLLGERLGDAVVLFLAETEDDGRPVAGALNLRGRDALYGRYWGCAEDYRFLHFEACYYRAIDYAIEHGLDRVEAGAQGEHKIARGYLPIRTWSAHWIADDAFRAAIARFLAAETEEVEEEITALEALSPFRRDGAG